MVVLAERSLGAVLALAGLCMFVVVILNAM
jgi:hypothetical protein